jgi:hypothetical protein
MPDKTSLLRKSSATILVSSHFVQRQILLISPLSGCTASAIEINWQVVFISLKTQIIKLLSVSTSRQSSVSDDEHHSPPSYHREIGQRSMDGLESRGDMFLQRLQPVQDFRNPLDSARFSREVSKPANWSDADGQGMYSDEVRFFPRNFRGLLIHIMHGHRILQNLAESTRGVGIADNYKASSICPDVVGHLLIVVSLDDAYTCEVDHRHVNVSEYGSDHFNDRTSRRCHPGNAFIT